MMDKYCHYHSHFFIHRSQFIPLLEALCYQRSDITYDNQQPFIMDEFKQSGFSVEFDKNGNINQIVLSETPEGDLDDLITPIATYVESGSFIELIVNAEDNKLKNSILIERWQFNGHRAVKEYYPVVLTPACSTKHCNTHNKQISAAA
ncbi:hypothetical protein [Spartinivicinus ruber]|uniref:hypothetical protein n=1 Tax=Spartinivicinus ruber TaxID=2683272 RepID=UPI0013D04FBB|nr:hypothetical protein [Spartinivicinus ruber]